MPLFDNYSLYGSGLSSSALSNSNLSYSTLLILGRGTGGLITGSGLGGGNYYGTGRRYSPLLPTILEGNSPTIPRRHPRPTPVTYTPNLYSTPRTTPAYRVAKPLNVDTANIDVSTPRKPPRRPSEDSEGGNRATIKRGRTVVRIHTKRLKDDPNIEGKKRQMTPGERLREKFTIRDEDERKKKRDEELLKVSEAEKEEAEKRFRRLMMMKDPINFYMNKNSLLPVKPEVRTVAADLDKTPKNSDSDSDSDGETDGLNRRSSVVKRNGPVAPPRSKKTDEICKGTVKRKTESVSKAGGISKKRATAKKSKVIASILDVPTSPKTTAGSGAAKEEILLMVTTPQRPKRAKESEIHRHEAEVKTDDVTTAGSERTEQKPILPEETKKDNLKDIHLKKDIIEVSNTNNEKDTKELLKKDKEVSPTSNITNKLDTTSPKSPLAATIGEKLDQNKKESAPKSAIVGKFGEKLEKNNDKSPPKSPIVAKFGEKLQQNNEKLPVKKIAPEKLTKEKSPPKSPTVAKFGEKLETIKIEEISPPKSPIVAKFGEKLDQNKNEEKSPPKSALADKIGKKLEKNKSDDKSPPKSPIAARIGETIGQYKSDEKLSPKSPIPGKFGKKLDQNIEKSPVKKIAPENLSKEKTPPKSPIVDKFGEKFDQTKNNEKSPRAAKFSEKLDQKIEKSSPKSSIVGKFGENVEQDNNNEKSRIVGKFGEKLDQNNEKSPPKSPLAAKIGEKLEQDKNNEKSLPKSPIVSKFGEKLVKNNEKSPPKSPIGKIVNQNDEKSPPKSPVVAKIGKKFDENRNKEKLPIAKSEEISPPKSPLFKKFDEKLAEKIEKSSPKSPIGAKFGEKLEKMKNEEKLPPKLPIFGKFGEKVTTAKVKNEEKSPELAKFTENEAKVKKKNIPLPLTLTEYPVDDKLGNVASYESDKLGNNASYESDKPGNVVRYKSVRRGNDYEFIPIWGEEEIEFDRKKFMSFFDDDFNPFNANVSQEDEVYLSQEGDFNPLNEKLPQENRISERPETQKGAQKNIETKKKLESPKLEGKKTENEKTELPVNKLKNIEILEPKSPKIAENKVDKMSPPKDAKLLKQKMDTKLGNVAKQTPEYKTSTQESISKVTEKLALKSPKIAEKQEDKVSTAKIDTLDLKMEAKVGNEATNATNNDMATLASKQAEKLAPKTPKNAENQGNKISTAKIDSLESKLENKVGYTAENTTNNDMATSAIKQAEKLASKSPKIAENQEVKISTATIDSLGHKMEATVGNVAETSNDPATPASISATKPSGKLTEPKLEPEINKIAKTKDEPKCLDIPSVNPLTKSISEIFSRDTEGGALISQEDEERPLRRIERGVLTASLKPRDFSRSTVKRRHYVASAALSDDAEHMRQVIERKMSADLGQGKIPTVLGVKHPQNEESSPKIENLGVKTPKNEESTLKIKKLGVKTPQNEESSPNIENFGIKMPQNEVATPKIADPKPETTLKVELGSKNLQMETKPKNLGVKTPQNDKPTPIISDTTPKTENVKKEDKKIAENQKKSPPKKETSKTQEKNPITQTQLKNQLRNTIKAVGVKKPVPSPKGQKTKAPPAPPSKKIKFPAPLKPLFMNPAFAMIQQQIAAKNEVTPPPLRKLQRFKNVPADTELQNAHQVVFKADKVSTVRHMTLKIAQKATLAENDSNEDNESSSDSETDSSGSDTETEETVTKVDRTSTSSEDSGFGSTHSSPLTNKNACTEGREGTSPHPARRFSTSLSSDSESGEEGSARRYTPPARTIPRFRKYSVEDYQFLKVLGKGSFGKVLLAELRGTECYYAVKCLKKDVVLEDDDVECTLIERKVLALGTRHPYLCHLFCTFQTESHLFFVMEYLNGGDLMFHIQQSGRFEQPRASFYAAEIVSGLKFLHKKGIVYRDLKLDNILLDYEGHVRIADFGMCKLQIYLDRTADTFCGTPDYMAPEIIKGLHYNQCVDWWSFGVLLYEMLIGQSPFNGCDEDELFWSICNEQPYYPRFLSKEAQSILQMLLEKDSSRRLGTPDCHAGDVIHQPFFKSIDWAALDRKELDPPFKPRVQHALDVQYFDSAFTQEAARLTPVDKEILQSMDQSQFHGFSYTNPNACNE